MVRHHAKGMQKAWHQPVQEVLEYYETSAEQGIGSRQVGERQRVYGKNRLKEVEKRSIWDVLIDQFESLIILLLGAASILSFVFGQWVDGLAILAAILINAIIGFVMELRATRSMESLRQMEQVDATAGFSPYRLRSLFPVT